jgi:hypothetical protein
MRHKRTFGALVGAGLLLAGCGPEAQEAERPRPGAGNNAVAEQPALPVPEAMGRAALLQAAARVASATALGTDAGAVQDGLDGRQFELRIRFGCPGAVRPSAPGPFRIRFELETRTLRLSAAPHLTLEEPWIAKLGGEGVETVEGFWMRRPWLLEPGCPAGPAPAPAPEQAASGQSATAEPPQPAESAEQVGIAQFFTEADPRTRRRDRRAYEATVTLPEGQQPSPQGYDLVLSGRLRELAGGRVIACNVTGADAPPDCVIAAEFDRVRFEHPDTKEVISEWGAG